MRVVPTCLAVVLALPAMMALVPTASAAHETDVFWDDASTLARWELNGDLLDSSGNGRHATKTSGAAHTFVATPFGQGIDINGWSDGLQYGSASTLVPPFTLEIVATPDAVTSWKRLFGANQASDFEYYLLNGRLQNYNNAAFGPTVTASTRFYVAIVQTTNTQWTGYVNGVLAGVSASTYNYATTPPSPSFFSDNNAGGSENFLGLADAIRISSGARTAAEIAAIQCRLDHLCDDLMLSSTLSAGSRTLVREANVGTADVGIVSGSPVTFVSEPALVNVGFGTDTWTGKLHYANLPAGSTLTVELGSASGGLFLPAAGASQAITVPGTGLQTSNLALTPTSDFSVPPGAGIALRVSASSGSGVVNTGGLRQSFVTLPASDPGFPLPELGTLVLAAAGTVAIVLVRRARR